MASFSHGVATSETATSLLATTEVLSAVPFVVGITPVNLAAEPAVNKPVLCYSQAEAVAAFGLENALEGADGMKRFRFGLSEFIYSTFNLYGQTPVVMVNVLDPAKHRKSASTVSVTLDERGEGVIAERGVLLDTLTIQRTDGTADTWIQGTDYNAAFDDDGFVVISSLSGEDGALIMPVGEPLTLSASVIDPDAVDAADIIGGIDAATGAKKGLETISEVYPRFGIIPTMVLAPGFSSDPEVAAVMATKAIKINTLFDAMALVDLPADTVTKYSDAPSVKSGSNLVDANMIACWPQVNLSGTVYHMSVALAGVIARNDSANDGIPYSSPSNKSVEATGLCLEDGTEVVLGNEEANYLNGQGIVTLLNFNSGWKIWGNRTAAYPASTDVKDVIIPVRRMFQYVADTVITTVWQKVDEPGNRRLIDSVMDTLNVRLNSMVARQYLLAGQIEFRQEDNSTADLMDGKYRFKIFLTPPSPAELLSFDLEIDVSAYETLF